MAENPLRHIFLSDSGESIPYTSPKPGGGGKKRIPDRDREKHSQFLKKQFEKAWKNATDDAVSYKSREGVYIEFRGQKGYELLTKSLDSIHSGIRLLSVRHEGKEESDRITYATVFIPVKQEGYFLKKIQDYAEKETPKNNPKNHDLINSINDIKLAVVESFWQDPIELIPMESPNWCEVWLSSHKEEIEERFKQILRELAIEFEECSIRFPERTVLLIKVNNTNLADLIAFSPDIAEFRLAKETARFWLELENRDQVEWICEILSRMNVKQDTDVSVCILDTGANNGHNLLKPILSDEDCLTWNPAWGSHDHEGHGTLMCGVVGYGDLQDLMESKTRFLIGHKIESVKILPPKGKNPIELWGDITIQSVSLSEIQNPNRKRILCMAITAIDTRDRGRPSSWSGAIDKCSSGYDDNQKRLFLVSAGNIDDSAEWRIYPKSNSTNSVHDPAQAWNALTVGAYTKRIRITDTSLKGCIPVANAGSLSPFSTTSITWESDWPIKPEIVFEGGNIARDSSGFCTICADLSLLSTSHEPTKKQFNIFNATSAASAQAAWMAAQIQTAYPHAWPETIRGLLVHTAEWTDEMKRQFLNSENKSDYGKLLRICGYGVPNLQRSIECANNHLTLIAQEEIQPYEKKEGKSNYSTKEMHLHEIPWPKDVLLELGEIPVTLRITLSYFIEPGPGERGWQDKYRYASHGLRFDLKLSTETLDDFKKRINKASREEDENIKAKRDKRWLLGKTSRDKGSIHSDRWKGTAAEIATCNYIGVYPVIGWWRERTNQKRWDRKTRYSLIVSLHTPEERIDIDIYTPVFNQVKIAQKIQIPIQ